MSLISVVTDDSEERFRRILLADQGECPQLKPLIAACSDVLGKPGKQSLVEPERKSKDYRLAPQDGVLERSVTVVKVGLLGACDARCSDA